MIIYDSLFLLFKADVHKLSSHLEHQNFVEVGNGYSQDLA